MNRPARPQKDKIRASWYRSPWANANRMRNGSRNIPMTLLMIKTIKI
jgi:hypothetical protein